MAGRPRKPTALHQLHGTYVESRHGKKRQADGELPTPVKPDGMEPIAAGLWNRVIEPLIGLGVVTVADEPQAAAMCRWFGMWSKTMDALEQADVGESGYKLMVQASSYWKQFASIAGKFGLSPADREKLSIDFSPKKREVAKRNRQCIERFLT